MDRSQAVSKATQERLTLLRCGERGWVASVPAPHAFWSEHLHTHACTFEEVAFDEIAKCFLPAVERIYALVASEAADQPGESASATEYRLASIERRLSVLEAAIDPLSAPQGITRHAAYAWIESHAATLAKYKGMDVAIHPTEGIVEASDNLGELYKTIAQRKDSEQILLYYVPPD